MISIGSTVGNYEVIAKLGSGAMGSVFLAEHPSIGKRVALKVIHSDLAANAEMVSRFFTEARAVTQIANEHIIDVQNFGQTPDGDNFIIMEFLDGVSLGSRLKSEGVLPLDVALHIGTQVAEGLAASHARGIVHRDLKPDNVFLVRRQSDPCFVKILDFGLAKLTQGAPGVNHKTQAGSVLGTPHYMAPEQCEGKPDIDHRVDIYALGCILYEMLCGRVPFPGEGFGEVLIKHLREPPEMPTRINPRIPRSVERIVLHALAKKKEFRFGSMDELGAALRNPDAYAQTLDGDRPLGASTLELLGAAPVRAESRSLRSQAPTMAAQAPEVDPFGDQKTIVSDSPPPAMVGDDTVTPPRRRRAGLVLLLGALAGVALAGIGAGIYLLVLRPRPAAVALASDPAGAQVTSTDGQAIGVTPLVVQVPKGEHPEVVVHKDGYLDARRELAAGQPEVLVHLVKRPSVDDLIAPVKVPVQVEADPPKRSPKVAEAPKETPEAPAKEVERPRPVARAAPRPVAKPVHKAPKKQGKKPIFGGDDVLEPSF